MKGRQGEDLFHEEEGAVLSWKGRRASTWIHARTCWKRRAGHGRRVGVGGADAGIYQAGISLKSRERTEGTAEASTHPEEQREEHVAGDRDEK